MVFTSYEFIAFFIIVFALYYLLPKSWQWVVLLVSGYCFYAISGIGFVPYLLTTTVTTFFAAILIETNAEKAAAYTKSHKEDMTREERKAYSEKEKHKRKWFVAGCLIINVGILAVVKYADFFIGNINTFLSEENSLSFLDIALPLGISYYTLQSIGYLVDVYRGSVKAQKNVFKFALFLSFFPVIIQGPISRYGELSETLYGPHEFDKKNVSYGLERILWGFFKKLVIADRLLNGVTTMLSGEETYKGAYVLVGMILYTVELYADFTGGIDITIGVAETLGIKVAENFNLPYFSKSLKEYWRRWHISMAGWFRDYVFYPVSTSAFMQKFSKLTRKAFGNKVGRKVPVYLSSFVVWFLTGIWHGANWNFIVWGLLNWAILMISEELEPVYEKFHSKVKFSETKGYGIFMTVRTFALICFLNLFDCFATVGETFKSIVSIFKDGQYGIFLDGSLMNAGLTGTDYLIVLGGVIVMSAVSFIKRKGSIRDLIHTKPYIVKYVIWLLLFLAVLLFGAYGVGYDSSQFIYNRF